MWLLKLLFDENSIIINHKSKCDFNSHIILNRIQIGFLKLLSTTCDRQPNGSSALMDCIAT